MIYEFDAIRKYSQSERLPQHFLGLFFLVTALYFGAWKFVEFRSLTSSGLALPRSRAFTLVASALVIETVLIRVGVVMAESVSTFRASPWNDELLWTLAIPFASATLLVAILMDVQMALTVGSSRALRRAARPNKLDARRLLLDGLVVGRHLRRGPLPRSGSQ